MKLSIITITYNNIRGLKKTLKSIKAQKYADYEQIVIDGGSTDGSVDLIQQYADMSVLKDRLIWVSEKDKGVYDAQNKGIMKAQGEYCLFLNAGDYFADEYILEKIFDDKTNADIIWGNLLVVNAAGKVVEVCKGKQHVTFLDVYSSIIKHQASFIKRNLFDKYGLYDSSLKIVADWDFFMKTVGFNNASLHYIDLDIACFENNGISYNQPELCEKERQQVLDRYMPRRMQEDYLLLKKYKNIRNIERSKVAFFLFRLLARCYKK